MAEKQSPLSEFYMACRNGDLATVQRLLPQMSYREKHTIETNGSTALHAATFYRHHTIVKLLLESGCGTWIRNKYNKTPYEEAQDDEMRQLFLRSDRNGESSRFSSTEDCFNLVTFNDDSCNRQTDVDENIPKGWVEGYKHVEGGARQREQTVQQIVHAQIMKYCLKKFQIPNTSQDIQKLLKKTLRADDKDCHLAQPLLDGFLSRGNIDDLVRLYTLETSFYGGLQKNVDSFAIELYSHLSALKERAFKGGRTYRGISMTKDGIKSYQWAATDKGRMIEIKTMTSTSLLEEVAVDFAKKSFAEQSENDNKHCVLFVLDFPDVCYTAIDLNVGESLSKYPHEKEVLLLPGTLFQVHQLSKDETTGWYRIQLNNVKVPQQILMRELEEFQDG